MRPANTRARPQGFTLIELLVVMAVLGVLALAAVPMAELQRQRVMERELRQALSEIRDAIDAYKNAVDTGAVKPSTESGFPASLAELAHGAVDARRAGQVRYFLRRVPRDPFADPTLAAEQTWGLRSHASPPENPQPGADVYDVYSKAPGNGMNGVPLRAW